MVSSDFRPSKCDEEGSTDLLERAWVGWKISRSGNSENNPCSVDSQYRRYARAYMQTPESWEQLGVRWQGRGREMR
jgi:hypothetical protein